MHIRKFNNFYLAESLLRPRNIEGRKEQMLRNTVMILMKEEVNADLSLSQEHLDCIYIMDLEPKVKFINGTLSLTGIKAFPKWMKQIEIYNDFECRNSRLKTLENSPYQVLEDYSIINNINEITSLEGCPIYVGRHFSVINSKLLSVKGCPKEIKGDLLLKNNYLQNIDGIAEHVEMFLSLKGNRLKDISNLPKYIGRDLNLVDNWITFKPKDVPNGTMIKGNVFFTEKDEDWRA